MLQRLSPSRIDSQVLTLEGGHYESTICELGIPVVNLEQVAHRKISRFLTVALGIKRFRPHIVHGMDSGGFYARLAARVLRVPAVVSGFNGSSVPNSALSWAEYCLSYVTDYVISNSYAGERCLVEEIGVNPNRVRVIQNGFDFAAASQWQPCDLHRELGLRPEQPLVGLVARLMDVKNPLMFVEAAARVHQDFPSSHFVIIGDGPLRPKVEAQVKSRGLQGSITLLGERSDAVNLIPGLTVGVLTSRSEGLPNALLEYMFWGRPVVVTDVGDCARVVRHGETGYVYQRSDCEALRTHISTLLHNPHTAARFGEAGRRRLEMEYTLERYCDSLLELYEAALRRSSSSSAF